MRPLALLAVVLPTGAFAHGGHVDLGAVAHGGFHAGVLAAAAIVAALIGLVWLWERGS